MLSHFSIAYLFSVRSACTSYPESLWLGISASVKVGLPCLRPDFILNYFLLNEMEVWDKLENLTASRNSRSQPTYASKKFFLLFFFNTFLCLLHWWGDSTLLKYYPECVCLSWSLPLCFFFPNNVLIAPEEIGIFFLGKLPVLLAGSSISFPELGDWTLSTISAHLEIPKVWGFLLLISSLLDYQLWND